jgi:hypothetical protein
VDCGQFEAPTLFAGTNCDQQVSSSIFFIDSQSSNFIVDTTSPISKIEICILMVSIGKVSQFQRFEIEVCGNEAVTVNLPSTLAKVYTRELTSTFQRILIA